LIRHALDQRGVAFKRVVKPKFGMPVNEQAVANALPMSKTCVAALEDIMEANAYFAGEALSLADLFAYRHFEFFAQSPESADIMAGSALLGWMERMSARPRVLTTTWDRLLETVAA
jgi:glutathione S-transferase